MFQTVWGNTTVFFQAVPDVPGYSRTYRKVDYVYFFLADVEEALVHGIACRALSFCFMLGRLFGFVDLLVIIVRSMVVSQMVAGARIRTLLTC